MIQCSAQQYSGTGSGTVFDGTIPKNRLHNRFPVPVLLPLFTSGGSADGGAHAAIKIQTRKPLGIFRKRKMNSKLR